MRVVLLVTDLELGGTPLRLARLARDLQAAGIEAHVGCLAPRGPVSSQLDAANVPNFACGARHAGDLAALWRLAANVRRIRPDLIHSMLTHANVAARLVGAALRVPVLTATATIEVERRWHRLVEMLTWPLDRGHLVNSLSLADHVSDAFGLPPRRVHIVPPSIDPMPPAIGYGPARAALCITADEFVVLWGGRLDRVKRVDLIVACAARLGDVPARFLLAGDGPDRRRIEELIRRSPAAGRIQLLGWRNDLPAVLEAADVFLFPSRTEGMPNVVLQAMARGLAIVASEIPTLLELSGEGQRMLLVASDQPEAYAEALRFLYGRPKERWALGQRAAAWAAAHLDPRDTVAAVLQVYQSVRRRQ